MSTQEEIAKTLIDHGRRIGALEDGQELIQDGITQIHASLASQDGRLDTIEANSTQARDGIVTLLGKESGTNGQSNLAVLVGGVRDICLSRFGWLVALAVFVAVAGVGALPTVLPLVGLAVQSPVAEIAAPVPEAPVEAADPEGAPVVVPEPAASPEAVSEDVAPVDGGEADPDAVPPTE